MSKKHLHLFVFILLICTGCGGGNVPVQSTPTDNQSETINTIPVAVIIPKVSIFIQNSTGDLVEITQPNPNGISIGTKVILDGTNSYDYDGDTLAYFWYVINKPSNSRILLSSTASSKPTFIPDIVGTYEFKLIVNDGWINSTQSNISINVR